MSDADDSIVELVLRRCLRLAFAEAASELRYLEKLVVERLVGTASYFGYLVEVEFSRF